MSVVGFDFGNDSCYIGVARAGGIEIIANDYSQRQTPSCVGFDSSSRLMGVSAKNKQITNVSNTVTSFKPLLGRSYRDAHVSRVISDLANARAVTETESGGVGVSVRYLDEQRVFSPEQITGMLFTKLKETAEIALKTKVQDVVISVPLYFTDVERRAVLAAAQLAGLNVLRLMNDTTAAALSYGIYKNDLPDAGQPPRHVVFVDCGHSGMQTAVVAFNKGKLKVLATAFDSSLGGGEFDRLLVEHFCAEFRSKYGIDVDSNPRARLRLRAECEKLKKQMSANTSRLPLNIECLMEDRDVSGHMERAEFEQLCAGLLTAAGDMLRRCLQASQLTPADIYSVEVVGGGSRVPSVKQLIADVLGCAASTTLNQDEAVARGCALQCAMLSPTFRVRDFSVTDQQPYTIRLIWPTGDMDIFPKNHEVPYSKMLTFYQSEDFSLTAKYSGDVPYPDPFIGTFTVKKVAVDSDNGQHKVKVKVRINKHGVFTVASATRVQRQEGGGGSVVEADDAEMNVDDDAAAGSATPSSTEPTVMDTGTPATTTTTEEETEVSAGAETADTSAGHSDDTDKTGGHNDADASNATATVAANGDVKEKPQRVKLIKTELPVEAVLPGVRVDQIADLVEQEAQMGAADKLEFDRQDAKNTVEEYVYSLRARLTDQLADFVTTDVQQQLLTTLEDTENWLYEDGENCTKSVYVNKLAQLKEASAPIELRHSEFEARGEAFVALSAALSRADKLVAAFNTASDQQYSHLDAEQVAKVEKAIAEKRQWIDQQMGVLANLPRHQPPPVTVANIHAERQSFESMANPILNKPKPVAPVKPAESAPPPAAPTDDASGAPSSSASANNGSQQTHNTMDVD